MSWFSGRSIIKWKTMVVEPSGHPLKALYSLVSAVQSVIHLFLHSAQLGTATQHTLDGSSEWLLFESSEQLNLVGRPAQQKREFWLIVRSTHQSLHFFLANMYTEVTKRENVTWEALNMFCCIFQFWRIPLGNNGRSEWIIHSTACSYMV